VVLFSVARLGSALNSGHFGDFMPSIGAGYPIGANIQSGTYNPLYLLFAGLFSKSVLSVNLLYLVIQQLLFVVAFLVGHTYSWTSPTSVVFALSLVACGFVTGHASHFSYLSSALGFVTVFLGLRFSLRNHTRIAALFAFVGAYHLATTGYPAIMLFGAQVMLAYVLVQVVVNPSQRKAIIICSAFALLGGLAAAPSLMHFLNQLQQSDRAAGLGVEHILKGSLPTQAYANFFWPAMRLDEMAGIVDPTMRRFHLLFTSPLLILVSMIACFKSKNRSLLLILGSAVLFSILAFGPNAPIPLREWLANHSFAYRVGRFPSGEHSGFALFAFAILAAWGFRQVERVASQKWLRAISTLVCIDFCIVMAATVHLRYMRLPVDIAGRTEPLQVVYTRDDQSKIDAPRGCPFDSRFEFDQRLTAPDKFSWNGYTNLFSKRYLDERSARQDLICGPSRLWNLSDRKPVRYELVIYSPTKIVIRVARKELRSSDLLWADVDDGFWSLTVNQRESRFDPKPANLRGIRLSARDLAESEIKIEMSYLGPLSRWWR
jgi:hypothetical protein